MRIITAVIAIAGAAALLIGACSGERDLVFDNPADPESPRYVGYEILDPAHPINVPTVDITGAPTRIKINVPYTYVAAASDPNPARPPEEQPGVLRYDWNFGDGTVLADTGASVQHAFTKAAMQGDSVRTFSVSVTVIDNDGNTVSESVEVLTTDYRPVADPGGPYGVKINVPLTFEGTASDPDGQIILYEWDFAGDGTYDWSSATTGTAQHTYTKADLQGDTVRTFPAALRVTDDDGNTTVATVEVSVTDLPPVADPGGPYSVKFDVPLTLVGTATDPDGEIVLYEWDFTGGGTYEWSSTSTGITQHTYTAAGEYTARFRAMDDDSNKTIVDVLVTVTDLPPTVAITSAPQTIKINVPYTYVASATDPDGEIVRYDWDFGDGTVLADAGASVERMYTKSSMGGLIQRTFTVSVTVHDDSGNEVTATGQVQVTDFRPTANAFGPYTVNANRSAALHGLGNDPDGRIVKYEWDFNGNGRWDWSSTTSGSATTTRYAKLGTFTPRLRVTDDDGNMTIATATLTVRPIFDFAESSDLDLFTQGADGTYSIIGGRLRITGTSEQYIAQVRVNDLILGDGTIEVETRFVSGSTNQSYGIRFRCPATGGGYGFGINGDGSYLISKWSTSGEWSALKNWTSSTRINKQGTNVLKAECSGSTMRFYINGTLVTTVTDATYTSGRVGLYGGQSRVIEFDDLVITQAAAKPTRDGSVSFDSGDATLSDGSAATNRQQPSEAPPPAP